MKLHKPTQAFCIAIALLTFQLTGCGKASKETATPTQEPKPPAQNTAPPQVSTTKQARNEPAPPRAKERPVSIVDPFEEEAIKLASEDFAKHWQICGESAYAEILAGPQSKSMGFAEKKGLKAPVVGGKAVLTQADKLNGLEWSGEVAFSCEVSRDYFLEDSGFGGPKKGWQPWSESSRVWSCTLQRTNGTWGLKSFFTGSSGRFLEEKVIPAKCEIFTPGGMEAEFNRRQDEVERLARLAEVSKIPTKTNATFSAADYQLAYKAKLKITVTDAGIAIETRFDKAYDPDTSPKTTLYGFVEAKRIGKGNVEFIWNGIQRKPAVYGLGPDVFFEKEQERDAYAEALLAAYDDWKKRHPELVREPKTAK